MRIEEIYRKYSAQLRGYISKYVSSSVDSEDILHDTFYKLITADNQDNIQSISSWLYRVAQNRIIDSSRKHKEESITYLKDSDNEHIEVSIAELLTNPKETPETELLRSMVWEELETALSELPEEQRIVFELNELEGIPFSEIAEVTNIPVNTLISRKRYAVLHLRQRLSSLYEDITTLY